MNSDGCDRLFSLQLFRTLPVGKIHRVPSGLCSLSIFYLLFYSTSSAYPMVLRIKDTFESAKWNASESVPKDTKTTPRVLRSFPQARIQDTDQLQEVSCAKADDNATVTRQTLVPRVSLYNFPQASDAESQVVGNEESILFYTY